MEPIAILLKESNGIPRTEEVVQLGIPIPRGALLNPEAATLCLENQPFPLEASFSKLAYWPDGSVKWLLAQFPVTLPANSDAIVTLKPALSSGITPAKEYEKTPQGWVIHTKSGSILLQERLPHWHVSSGNNTGLSLKSATATPCQFLTTEDWVLKQHGSVTVEAILNGKWQENSGQTLANFQCRLTIALSSGTIDIETCLHNPDRARHPGGLWDLGDQGSRYFGSLDLEIDTQRSCTAQLVEDCLDPSSKTHELVELDLVQNSSGGEHWNSLNHIDRNGEVTTQFRGYRVCSSAQCISRGNRANPLLINENPTGRLQIAIPRFWQNCPTSLRYCNRKITAGLFPAQYNNQPYELQGGERKTLRCVINYSNPNENLARVYAPLTPIVGAEAYESASAFPWFRANSPPDALDTLLKEGLDGPNNFFAKREIIDEYGWRNFGDIFADHETLYQQSGEEPLISHYNNQYDAIYGFARQFALTGDRRWFELMDDLARHVTDIDIYHTEEDRAEYNNGLFWHTDHYLPAHTATHRTFSQYNDTSSTPGQTGGGPAAEHCYTTGLMYHYLMTGCTASCDAVLNLAQWLVSSHEGEAGLLAQMLALKKHDIPQFKALIKRKKLTVHRYAFTRGTGNYINALIDANILEPESDWLSRAEAVIVGTIHPGDSIADRNLLDVENNWHYLILLTSLSNYLSRKLELSEYDEQYQYALASLRHYTRWMLANEKPFLANPEQLEFANHTWVAQDIRKAMLMYQATTFDPSYQHLYLSKAQEWMGYVAKTMKTSTEKHLSRIQIILLQNYGPHQSFNLPLPKEAMRTDQVKKLKTSAPELSPGMLLARITHRIIKGLTTFRPGRERDWLKARLGR